MAKCPDCGKPFPRRVAKVWVVTWAGESPPYWREDVPIYFTTRREAKEYRDALEADPEYVGEPLVVESPDDVAYDDVVWHSMCML